MISLPKRRKRCCTANGIPVPACTSLTMAAGSPAARPELLQAHVFSGFHYQLCDLKRMSAQHVTKICFCGDHDDLRRLRIQLNETLGDRAFLCFSAMDCLEVLPVGCNKGAALAVLSQHLGFTLQECMAFGDAMNDREMLGSVGRGSSWATRCRS